MYASVGSVPSQKDSIGKLIAAASESPVAAYAGQREIFYLSETM